MHLLYAALCQTLRAHGYSGGDSRRHWQIYNALRSGRLQQQSSPVVVAQPWVSGIAPAAVATVVNDSPATAPTPAAAVDALVALQVIREGDVIIECGSGKDARLSVAAVRAGAASAIALEIDAKVADQARRAVAGDSRITVYTIDAGLVDMRADVVLCYLDPVTLDSLAPRMKRHARTVASYSHGFDGAWKDGDWWIWTRADFEAEAVE